MSCFCSQVRDHFWSLTSARAFFFFLERISTSSSNGWEKILTMPLGVGVYGAMRCECAVGLQHHREAAFIPQCHF